MSAGSSAVAPLLVELQTEELPPRALRELSEAFAAGIEGGLRKRKLLDTANVATAYATPRRLAVHLCAVAARSPDERLLTKLMPLSVARDAEGRASVALRRKLAAAGHEPLADRLPAGPGSAAPGDGGQAALVIQSDGKADAVFLRSVAAGTALADGLQAALDDTLASLPIPKVMSYQLADGTSTVHFIRPAHRLLALHGREVVGVQALGLSAGRSTRGHRFLSAGDVEIESADSYARQLEAQGKVIASLEARRARVRTLLERAARPLSAEVIAPAELLDEVTALVEWPVVYESGFESEFLEVPEECLILTMQQNQKYFALRDARGALMNRFLLVSNLETDDPSAIVAGNARVVRARLADARFFFDQDRKQTLESRIPGLAHVVYQARLGSQLERVERITGIAVALAARLGVDRTHVERAARLAKADLRTLMVGEFPELQGIMGEHYARHDGEAADVAQAIREHYLPRHAGDALPATAVGSVVALADKLETLVGLFSIGQRPTGDKDPFALRRHTLGVLRIVIEQHLPLRLDEAIAMAMRAFGWRDDAPRPAYAAELEDFVWERLRGYLRELGYSAAEIASVVDDGPQALALVPERLAAVRAFAALPDAQSLAAANKRIVNILRKAGQPVAGRVDPSLLAAGAEQRLATLIEDLAPQVDARMRERDFAGALALVARAREAVDAYFDDVMVMAEDAKVRNNRLALLARLRDLMNQVADISRLSAA